MAKFAMLGRRSTALSTFPSGFEAVGEALDSGQDPTEACAVAGRELAIDGISMDEALTDLRATWLLVRESDPPYGAMAALSVAWTDATLAYLHHLSCEDPMTGLANLVHVRGRIAELYLQTEQVHDTWAVIVVELPAPVVHVAHDCDGSERLVHSMRLVRAAQAVRTVFVHGETVGRAGTRRILAIVERDERLVDRVSLLHRLLDDAGPEVPAPRYGSRDCPATTTRRRRCSTSSLADLTRLSSMCGRYASSRQPEDLIEEFEVVADRTPAPLAADYNVAPTKEVYAVVERPPTKLSPEPPERQLRVFTWGLIPSWAKDPSIGNRMINARMETVAEKPAYKKAFAVRRCLLPADGYFEWYPTSHTNAKGKPVKQPYFIRPADGGVLAMAGLYEIWRDQTRADDDPDRFRWTCTVLTTEAEDSLGHIHDRMPLMVERDRWSEWLIRARAESCPCSSRPHRAASRPTRSRRW